MDRILVQYEKLRDVDQDRARKYAEQVLNAIEMGGDSTHIDAATRAVNRR